MNTAIITTMENFDNDGLVIFLEYNGDPVSVESFLEYCKNKNYGSLTKEYGFARLTQVIANFFGGTQAICLGKLSDFDYKNCDNGVYIVNNLWNIICRMFYNDEELSDYTHSDPDAVDQMVDIIADMQPTDMFALLCGGVTNDNRKDAI